VAFWDASAIVQLGCSQGATNSRRLLRDAGRMVVWWGTPVEARSAFARLVRDGSLTDAECVKAVTLPGQLRQS
jgi:hypothetical protein